VEKILLKANEKGLVHQLITAPTSEYFYVICSCCPCCCVMLQTAVLQHHHQKNTNIALSSKFASVHNKEQCIVCGNCSISCYFSARRVFNNLLVYQSNKCVGCGLCVTKCPVGAISMKRREIYRN